ncbi:hypothetical protein [Streptomyces sp. NRRL B-24484]|uniref:hypothetical protein n=1 Tax=Streptomyces sp. NRRL B-24484 TaxID=1463833 RepID=UPI0004C24B42|nr:hypothetical protein [Streptomyces sp. NRRL B-24484]
MSKPSARQRPAGTSPLAAQAALVPAVEGLRVGGQTAQSAAGPATSAQPAPAAGPVARESDWVQMGTYVPKEIKQAFKVRCARLGIEMRQACAEAYQARGEKNPAPWPAGAQPVRTRARTSRDLHRQGIRRVIGGYLDGPGTHLDGVPPPTLMAKERQP